MNSIRAVSKLVLLGALAIGVVTLAATKGDPQPFAQSGVAIVRGWDAGTGAPVCLGIVSQNSIMVRNWQGDGGTSATLFCGFNTSVNATSGMPLQNTETLTVDLVALTQGFSSTATPGLTDSGVSITVGAGAPKLCCIGAAGSAPTDLRWMIVK